jgi:hypothetical protein
LSNLSDCPVGLPTVGLSAVGLYTVGLTGSRIPAVMTQHESGRSKMFPKIYKIKIQTIYNKMMKNSMQFFQLKNKNSNFYKLIFRLYVLYFSVLQNSNGIHFLTVPFQVSTRFKWQMLLSLPELMLNL